jgi:predicted RNA binding protein YcfA (HicA-like mRNA interferase family)
MSKVPSVSGDRIVRALKRARFIELRQRGSHVSLEKRTTEGTFRVVVPMHSPVAKGTLSDIIKDAGLTLEDFLELL